MSRKKLSLKEIEDELRDFSKALNLFTNMRRSDK